MRTKTITDHLKCHFTHSELVDFKDELSSITHQLNQLEADKKRVIQDFNSKINEKKSQINILSNKINAGYEFRNVECTVYYNTPFPMKKEVRRNDTNDIVEVLDMSILESQEEFEPIMKA